MLEYVSSVFGLFFNIMNSALQEFNDILMELFGVYRRIAATLEVSESELWILYEMHSEAGPVLQRELIERTGLPKQTINSTLRKMEAAGYIEQKAGSDRRTRAVSLTEKGRGLANNTAGRLIEAEMAALHALGESNRRILFDGIRRYTREISGRL